MEISGIKLNKIGKNIMDIKLRTLELLNLKEEFYKQAENYFDDDEKNIVFSKIKSHQKYIATTKAKINNPSTSNEEIVKIYSEVINKYFT